MTDQASTQDPTTPTSGQVPDVTQPTAGPDLSARIAALEAHNKELMAENAKRRIDAKTAEERATEKALREQGDFKTLVDKMAPELESAKAKAARFDAWEAAETQRLTDAVKAAPSFLQKAIAAASSLEAKKEIFDEWKASQPAGQPQRTIATPPAQGAPAAAPNTSSTVDGLLAQGWSLSKIKAEAPEIWAAEVNGSGTKGPVRIF